jgi:hypothetical protein
MRRARAEPVHFWIPAYAGMTNCWNTAHEGLSEELAGRLALVKYTKGGNKK